MAAVVASCPHCGQSMDRKTGHDWECRNVLRCKSNHSRCGQFRWFCSSCQADICNKCRVSYQALTAPFFASRVGCSVVSYGPAERTRRGLGASPHFKERYDYGLSRLADGMSKPDYEEGGSSSSASNAAAWQREQKLRQQIANAKAEIEQLTTALKVSTGAFEQATALAPPGLREHSQARSRMFFDLVDAIKRKDAEILAVQQNLTKGRADAKKGQEAVLKSLQGWGPNGGRALSKRAFNHWVLYAAKQKQENEVLKNKLKHQKKWKDQMIAALIGMANKNRRAELEVAFHTWQSCHKTSRSEKKSKKLRDEIVSKMLVTLMPSRENLLIASIRAWWRRLQEVKQEKAAEERRQRNAKDAKQMRFDAINAKVMMMVSEAEGMESAFPHVVIRAWRSQSLEGQVERAREKENALKMQIVEKSKEAQRARVMRMFSNDESKESVLLLLKECFSAWTVAYEKRLARRIELIRKVFNAWQADTRRNHHQHETKKAREELQKQEKEHEQLIQANANLLKVSLGDNPDARKRIAWYSWTEFCAQEKKRREKEEQQQLWKKEMEAREKTMREEQRKRATTLMLQRGSENPEGLLRIVWSAWIEDVKTEKLEKSMSFEQRVFQDTILVQRREEEEARQDQHDEDVDWVANQAVKELAGKHALLPFAFKAWQQHSKEFKAAQAFQGAVSGEIGSDLEIGRGAKRQERTPSPRNDGCCCFPRSWRARKKVSAITPEKPEEPRRTPNRCPCWNRRNRRVQPELPK